MAKYTRTIDSTITLPDLGLTVKFGDVVDLPADFFVDEDQAVASGFAPASSVKSSSASTPSDAASQGVDNASIK